MIAKALGLEAFDEVKLRACCPFHAEDTPSFIYNAKNYTMHCFGCQKTVDLIDVYMLKGMTYVEAVEKLFEDASITYAMGEHRVKTKNQYRYPKAVTCVNKDRVYQYMESRCISRETVDYAGLQQDEKGNVVFNYYDTNDVLTMVKYRPSRKVAHGENKMWCQQGADTAPILFNMNKINTSQPLLITEGEGDCLAAIESGFTNAVSVPLGAGNFHWIEECWEWLNLFESIIICSDNDDAGIKMQKEASYRLGAWRTKIVDIPTSITTEDGKTHKIKDLNEYLYFAGKDKVIDLIVHASDTPVAGAVDYSDIKRVDLRDMPGIKTGIAPLDRYLRKLYYGTLTVMTGINGSGKSSFLSQLICQCLNQDAPAFLYSGELPNFQSKSWIEYIMAGQRNIRQYEDVDGTPYWIVTKDASSKINDYCKGKLFIYDDEYTNGFNSIMQTVEGAVRKYGTKLVILDNLTSINLEADDTVRYMKQAELVQRLISFAKTFNVAVVLVVHPHKIETIRRLTKMDIQGMSAIIDLAHRIISLYRVQESDREGIRNRSGKGWKKAPIQYDVLCDILKDRMTGREGKTIGMYYDEPSRRFFTTENDLDINYGWDDKTYNGELPYPPKQLVDLSDEIFGKIGGDNH